MKTPHNNDVEKKLLAGIIAHPQELPEVLSLVSAENFYNSRNVAVFSAIVDLFDKGEGIGYETLSHRLGLREGDDWLAELVTSEVGRLELNDLAKLIKELSIRRAMLFEVKKSETQLTDTSTDVFETLNSIDKTVMELSGVLRKKKPIQLGKLLPEFTEKLEEIRSGKRQTFGTATGFKSIDDYLGGFCAGELYVIAGRPSQGKTALALKIAENISSLEPIAFYSLEMASNQLVGRLLSIDTGIENYRIRTGTVSDFDFPNLVKANSRIYELKFFVDDQSSPTLLEIKAKTKKMILEHGIRGVFIDYLGLITPPRAERRDLEVGLITAGLKSMAKELDIYVVLLSQLSRGVERREDKRPELSDLRDSGNIEQDADVVLFIYRPEQYGKLVDDEMKESLLGVANIIIAKQRNGPIGTVQLRFVKECARFENP